jgi:hypothetical protein
MPRLRFLRVRLVRPNRYFTHFAEAFAFPNWNGRGYTPECFSKSVQVVENQWIAEA